MGIIFVIFAMSVEMIEVKKWEKAEEIEEERNASIQCLQNKKYAHTLCRWDIRFRKDIWRV